MLKKLLTFKGILIAIAIFGIIFALLGLSGKLPFLNNGSKQKLTGNLRVWGIIPKNDFGDFEGLFNKTAKTYSMSYKEVDYNDFNLELIKAIADGNAPDIIIGPSELSFANEKRIYPISTQVITESNFRNYFINTASILYSPLLGGYLGLPISIDPLILYYNRDILSSHGILYPPKTWADVIEYTKKISGADQDGNTKLSTIAFGTYDNIPHISDILLSLVFQQGQIPVSFDYKKNADGLYKAKYNVLLNENLDPADDNSSALSFAFAYTKDFSDTQKEVYNWNSNSSDALSSFVGGELAFYIGYASELSYIKSANQKLYFDYTVLPQISEKNLASFGRLNTISILNTSPNINLAEQVVVALTTGVFSQDLTGVVGGVSALTNNINTLLSSGIQSDEILGRSALISKNFPDLHRNDLEKSMREAIRLIYSGAKSTTEASSIFTKSLQDVYDEKK